MLLSFTLLIVGIFVSYVIFLIVKPLHELIRLKLKHGKDIYIEFVPIMGEVFYQKKGLSRHKDMEFYRRQAIEKYPDVKIIATNFLLDQVSLAIIDPQLCKQFFQSQENYRKYNLLLFNDLVFSQGLFYTEDQQWRDQRKIIGHQFNFENLKCITKILQKARLPKIKELTKQIFSNAINQNEDVKLLEVTAKITGEILTQTFFGNAFNGSLVNGLSITDAVIECIATQFELSDRRLWTHVRGKLFGFQSDIPYFLLVQEEKVLLEKLKNLEAFVLAFIAKREQDFDFNESNQNTDFIQIQLAESKKTNQKINKVELLHQFTTLAFAGTDSTSALTTLACHVLSQNQDLQDEIRNNIREHIKEFDDITQLDLNKLDKLSALCKEVLRMYPPANGLFLRYARQKHQLGNFTIKPSYIIDVGVLPVQQSTTYYDRPEEFRIDRWLNNELKEPHAFIAFASGPRNCIGQHMAQTQAKIMITYLLMNYRLKPDPARSLEMTLTSLYVPADSRLVHFELL